MTLELVVEKATGPAYVQDGGRPGHLGQGVPRGGALVLELLAQANRALGNPPLAPGLEIYADLQLIARQDGDIAIDGQVRSLVAGDTLPIERPRRHRPRYLAVPGGLDVPERLGGFGTLDIVGLGGFEGRALRRGDVLRSRSPGSLAGRSTESAWDRSSTMIRILAGPDVERFDAQALATLAAGTFVISPSSNRVGTRLLGAALQRRDGDDGISTPMVTGAIQVPASGEPIILGPDHPTLGGYPVVAVVARADWGALFARRPGSAVCFEWISLEAARAAAVAWDATWTR